jgi:hypothetical protein
VHRHFLLEAGKSRDENDAELCDGYTRAVQPDTSMRLVRLILLPSDVLAVETLWQRA